MGTQEPREDAGTSSQANVMRQQKYHPIGEEHKGTGSKLGLKLAAA
jgi:hypothetical protein